MFGFEADAFDLVVVQTKIQQHGSTGVAVGKNDVVGFNVPMDHATGMACTKGCEQHSGRLDCGTDFDTGLRLAPSSKGRSLDELGRDIGLDLGVLPPVGIALYQTRNALGANGVVSASFPEEARSPFRFVFGLDNLQERHVLIKLTASSPGMTLATSWEDLNACPALRPFCVVDPVLLIARHAAQIAYSAVTLLPVWMIAVGRALAVFWVDVRQLVDVDDPSYAPNRQTHNQPVPGQKASSIPRSTTLNSMGFRQTHAGSR